MFKKIRTWALAATVALATVACTSSEVNGGKIIPVGEKTSVKLKLSLAPTAANPTINNVWILQWDAAGNNKVCYKERYQDTNTLLEASLVSGNDMKVAVIAGVSDGTVYQLGTSYADFCKKGYPTQITSDAQVPYSGVQQVSITQKEQVIDMPLKWIASKISFSIASASASGYTLKSAQVKNVATTIYLLPDPAMPQTYGPGNLVVSEFDKTQTYYISENLQGNESGITSIKDRVTTKKATYIEVIGTKKSNDKRITATFSGFYGNNDTDNFDINRANSYSQVLTIDFDAQNDKRITRAETSADLNIAVPANSYMLSPTETIPLGIPVSRVNAFWLEQYDDNRYAIDNGVNDGGVKKWIAKVIWETEPGLVSFRTSEGTDANGYVAVLPGTAGKVGNALIGLFDATKTSDIDIKTAKVLWSWHIWVTDYTPGDGTNDPIPTVTGDPGRAAVAGGFVHYFNSLTANPTVDKSQPVIMDRDLGAVACDPTNLKKSTGMFYEWGRKDPFYVVLHEDDKIPADGYPLGETGFVPGATSHFTIENGPISIAKAVQSPTLYITCVSTPSSDAGYDWLQSGNDNDNLWAHATDLTKKTIYDPCPPGWKVPHDTKTFESLMHRNVWEPSSFNPADEAANIAAGIADEWGYYNQYPVQGVVCWDNTTQFFSNNSGRINCFNGKLFVYGDSNQTHMSTAISKKSVWILYQHSQIGVNTKEDKGLIEVAFQYRTSGCSVRCVKE